MTRGKAKRQQEEIVAGVGELRQAKEEEDGLGAGREAKGREPQEGARCWANNFQPERCPMADYTLSLPICF